MRLSPVVRLYACVARFGFRCCASYRAAALAGAFTNTVFGFVRAYVLLAVWHARPALGGYAPADAVTFCFVTPALIGPAALLDSRLELAERVRTGDVAIDLYRPADLQAWWLADDLGRAAFQALLRSVPALLVGATAFSLRLPGGPLAWTACGLSLTLAVLISFALRYIVTLSSFWVTDDRGVTFVAGTAAMFFSEMTLPLVLFPAWLGVLARALPWSAMVQVPADVFLGKHTGWGLAGTLATQLTRAAVLLALGRLLTTAACRRLEVHGG